MNKQPVGIYCDYSSTAPKTERNQATADRSTIELRRGWKMKVRRSSYKYRALRGATLMWRTIAVVKPRLPTQSCSESSEHCRGASLFGVHGRNLEVPAHHVRRVEHDCVTLEHTRAATTDKSTLRFMVHWSLRRPIGRTARLGTHLFITARSPLPWCRAASCASLLAPASPGP